jgi:hypothetical protein
MDSIEQFILENCWRFPKGYPDINNEDDKDLLFNLFNENFTIIRENNNNNIGFHIGGYKRPSETLSDRNWYFGNKTGYLGTGFYFYGDLENAKKDAEFLNLLNKSKIISIDLSKYNLFRSDNPEMFYDNMVKLTQQIGLVSPEISDEIIDDGSLNEALDDIVDVVKNDLDLSLEENTIKEIIIGFIKDVRDKNDGPLLSNRLLIPLNYEGINNINTPLDNFGVGSVLFNIKEESISPLEIEK